MSSNMKDLEEKLEELERKVEVLTDRCHALESRMVMLAISKISDPRYPYWNWLLSSGLPDDLRLKLHVSLSALSERLAGEPLPEEQQKDIDGVPRELLYGTGPFEVEEVFAAIKSLMREVYMESNLQILEMFRVIYEQGQFQGLCEYILSSSFVSSLPRKEIP